jgi:two-component system response regulator PilR (NtrC family)
LLRRALDRRGALVCPDLRRDAPARGAESVRSLRLRFAVAVPVPLPGRRRTVLILDSRLASRLAGSRARELARSFAGLLGLALAAEPAPRRPGPANDDREPGGPAAETETVELTGRSAASRDLLDWIRRVAPSELPVLVCGETGTGKEAVARTLHRSGPRRNGPFVAVNCTALSESLLEAELFGSRRGAYTGADRDRPGLFRLAHGGTLFLDEVGDTSPAMQAKLLRALQERRVRPVGGEREIPVDARILAATHRDLAGMVQNGLFRADLYHRLAVLEVRVPPLRERRRDLFPLVRDLGIRLARETGCGRPRLAACAWRALRGYSWPGNVRELHSVLARALLRARGRTILARDLDLPELPALPAAEPVDEGVDLERRMIETALRAGGGCVSDAARRIGWTRQKLYRRMQAMSIAADGLAGQARNTSSDSSTFQ